MNPDSSVFLVIALVLVSTVLLNTLIFQPILRVMNQRAGAVRDARELADSAAKKAADAAAEYDRTLTAARTDVYRQMDEKRRAALDSRASLLAATRRDVEQELASATARVREQSSAARQSIDQQAGELAGAIVERVLGRAS
ncbi:MAG: ATP synthase F0 subunit B [Vicinamibacterales bacterium]